MILQKACKTFATKIKENVSNKSNLKAKCPFYSHSTYNH